MHEPHALAAAAGDRLQQHGEAELGRGDSHLGQRRATLGAGHERHAGRLHLSLGARLVAHPLHHVRVRPDEDEIVVLARAHEGRVLGEEAVAGVNGLAAGRLGGGDHVRDPEVALGRRRRADADRAVREPDMQSIVVGGGVHGDRFGAELVDRADHPDGDLAAVCDQDPGEHQRTGGATIGSSSNRSCSNSTGLPFSAWIATTRPAASDFSSLKSFIASIRQSV